MANAPIINRKSVNADDKTSEVQTDQTGTAAAAGETGASAGNPAAGDIAAADEQGTTESQLAREQGQVVQEPAAGATRRQVGEEKVMHQQTELSPAQQIEAQFGQTKSEAPKLDRRPIGQAPAPVTNFMFMSPYASLQIYVDLGATEKDKDGQIIPRHYPVKFRSGVFKTTDARIASAIRMHPRCGTGTFREELNAQAFAVRAAAASARDNLRSPSFAGPTASTDGQDATFHAQDHELARAESRLFEL